MINPLQNTANQSIDLQVCLRMNTFYVSLKKLTPSKPIITHTPIQLKDSLFIPVYPLPGRVKT